MTTERRLSEQSSRSQIASPQPDDPQDQVQGMLGQVVKAMGEILQDITTLEVNTMIVTEITGGKFVPETAYQNIYYCLSPDQKIPAALQSRFRESGITRMLSGVEYGEVSELLAQQYWDLRAKLERDYRFIFNRPSAQLPNPATHWDDVKSLFANARFLGSLRKSIELKSVLGRGVEMCDIIYAQTVVQLSGDVINRFDQRLFQLPDEQKGFILRVHQEGVMAGEEQWRELLAFSINLVTSIAEKLGGAVSSAANRGIFSRNGKK